MLTSISNVFRQELNSLLRNKRLWVILFLIPLLFTLLFGFLYQEKTIKDIKVGVINESPSQLSRNVIEGFRKSEKFQITTFLADSQQGVEMMKKGEIDVVLIIPEDFTANVKKGKSSTVFVGANGSNMTISNTAMTAAADIIGTISAGVSIKKFTAGGMLGELAKTSALPINLALRPWYNPTGNYSNFLLLGYLTAVIQQVTLYFSAIAITEDRKNGKLKELVEKYPNSFAIILGKLLPYVLLSLISWLITIALAVGIFATPFRGSIANLLILSTAFFLCINGVGIFISIVAKNSVDAIQYSMLVALPSFLICGFTWPIETMLGFYKVLAHIFPLTYFAENVRSLALMGVNFNVIKGDVAILLAVFCGFILLSMLAFRHKYVKKLQLESEVS